MDPGKRDVIARSTMRGRPRRSSAPFGVILALLALLAGRIGPLALCVVVTLVAAFGALELATSLKRHGASLHPLVAAAGGAAFPVAAYLWGEAGIPAAAGASVVGFSGALAVRGLRPGTVRTLAGLLLPGLYVGLCLAYVVLIRGSAGGRALLEIFLGMVVAYRVGAWVGARRADPLSEVPSMSGIALGSVACALAAAAGGYVLLGGAGDRPPVGAMLGVGLLVGLAATVGALASTLFAGPDQPEKPERPAFKAPPQPVLSQLEAALLAAPAFFYAFRLLLT